MTPGDVVTALREQNVQVAAGQVGAPPAPGQADFQISVNTQGRLETEDQFGDIVVRAGPNGEISHLRDVARIELGSDNYALRSLLDNHPAVALPIFQRPGTNALQMAEGVKATMDRLAKDFPEGITYHIVYDTTGFVHESINAVIHTLFEALILVVPGGGAVPAELARLADPPGRRAGRHRRHLRRDGGPRIQLERYLAVRLGACDRHRGRRRHRRRRERGALDGARPRPARTPHARPWTR